MLRDIRFEALHGGNRYRLGLKEGLATVEIRVVRLGSFQNLYLSFAIVEITHGVNA